jgi:hypothetical protein
VNFAASRSAVRTVTVTTAVLPTVATTMRWIFEFSGTYSKVLSLVASGPPAGGSVIVQCTGHSCPFTTRTIHIAKRVICKAKSGHRCSATPVGTLNLTSRLIDRHLAIGTRLIVKVVKAGWVGKFYEFTVTPQVSPQVSIKCLAPGSSRPGVGC